jgi:hypothetical protein
VKPLSHGSIRNRIETGKYTPMEKKINYHPFQGSDCKPMKYTKELMCPEGIVINGEI